MSTQVASAQQEKNLGNEAFKSNQFNSAINHYTKAISFSNDNTFLLQCYSNRSACYLKLNMFEEAIKDARLCKAVDPSFIKGYIREIESLEGKGKFKEALEICKAALEIDSNDVSVMNKKKRLEELLRKNTTSSMQIFLRYGRYFLFANIFLSCLPLSFSWGKSSFYIALYADIALNVCILYANNGIPKLSDVSSYLTALVNDSISLKVLYSVLLLVGKSYFMSLLPILFSQLINFTADIFNICQSQLPKLQSVVVPLLNRYAPQIQYKQLSALFSNVNINRFNYQLMQLSAFMQVMFGVYLVIEVILLPSRNIILTALYWQFLQMSYILDKSNHIKIAFLELDRQITKMLSYKFVPIIIMTAYMKLKEYLSQKVSASTNRNSGGSFLSQCCIS